MSRARPSKLATSHRLRLLRVGIPTLWAAAWIFGIGILVHLAADLHRDLADQDLQTELALYATTAYGLTWFEEDGTLHDDLLRRELAFDAMPFTIWIVQPSRAPRSYPGSLAPSLTLNVLPEVAHRAIEGDRSFYFQGHDTQGAPYLLYAIPTYPENSARPHAAIVVVGSPAAGDRAHRAFVARLWTSILLLGALGIGLAIVMSRWTLRPVLTALRQREAFLATTAHELRTPLATLQSVCDSAMAGDEDAERALLRITPVVRRTGQVVDDLLLYARLDIGDAALSKEAVRLDLLVEAVWAEDFESSYPSHPIQVLAPEVVIEADPRLLTVAIRNLIANAVRYAAHPEHPVRIEVTPSGVVIEDRGPGFDEELLRSLDSGHLPKSPRGAGLGLSIVRRIAALHGGHLELSNRPQGGARARLAIPKADLG